MSAGKMREMLMRDYPSRFSIPGETEIKSWIGAQQSKKKYKKKRTRDVVEDDHLLTTQKVIGKKLLKL